MKNGKNPKLKWFINLKFVLGIEQDFTQPFYGCEKSSNQLLIFSISWKVQMAALHKMAKSRGKPNA
jgi:hypothetical protein